MENEKNECLTCKYSITLKGEVITTFCLQAQLSKKTPCYGWIPKYNVEKVSNCCGANVTETESNDGFGRCSKCKEHCEVIKERC